MDCCNYSEYRSSPYYYWGGYPPYWGGVGYPGGGYPSQPYGPPAPTPTHTAAYHPPPHVHQPRDTMDYGHAHTHPMPTDYGYASKERFRIIRERERSSEIHRGSLEWAECSYMSSACEPVRETPWSYSWNQNNCNGWQSSGRSGYPLRPVALQGGFPPTPPSLGYPHRDPLRGMAAMQATSIAQDKSSFGSWEPYHGREIEEERITTPQNISQPPQLSPAPGPYRSPRTREENTPIRERARKNKSPKNTKVEDSPPPPPPPPPPPIAETEELLKPKPDAIPLPAFKQAFGSTEIGRFSEAFTSTGAITEDMVSKAISQGLIDEWKDPENWEESIDEPPWMVRNKEIKCDDSF